MIEILCAGALSTVQDAGRTSYRRFGVGTAGAMDQLALAIGNLLVGNSPGAAGIEVPVLPFRVRFLQAVDFAVSGADCLLELDAKPLLPCWKYRAHAGQILSLGRDGEGFSTGARSYLMVSGGIDVPPVLGSRSTQLRGQFGGYQGRALLDGDMLKTGSQDGTDPGPRDAKAEAGGAGFGVLAPDIALDANVFFAADPAASVAVTAVRVLPAAEYTNFNASSLDDFWKSGWKITAQSDRYGYRLAGPPLGLTVALETRSHGVVPGVIQVPPSGQPIIQMRDAQPSGGYPKIGSVIEADLWRLAQALAGSRLRFVQVNYPQAVAASKANQVYLEKVRDQIALYRSLNV